MAFCPITSWRIEGGKAEAARAFLSPKALRMKTQAMKLKDTCSLEVKLWQA